MKKIILASGSPRRKELLKDAGFEFEIIKSNYLEDMTLPMDPPELAKHLSRGKAQEVAQNVLEPAIIIAADTFVVFKGKVIGKPISEEDAKNMLSQLSGNKHSVITGFTVLDTKTKEIYSEAVESSIVFKEISQKQIDDYVASGEPLEMAGSYAIQGVAGVFIERIEGERTGIIGLPMEALKKTLDRFGVCV